MQNTLDQKRLFQIFFPYAFQKQQKVLIDNQRFVHYTSADTAMNIIRNREVWMRNATCMNDFMEVEYGLKCLSHAYESPSGQLFINMLDNIFLGISHEIKQIFNSWYLHFKYDTYLTCVSEHLDTEDTVGRLSMWRAYGKGSGVALVFNNKPFLASSDALKAYSNPVAYLNKEGTEAHLKNITENIIRESDFLKVQKRETIIGFVFNCFKFAALCIKHPGFQEEKEWRVVYLPTMAASNHLVKEILSVNGTPQHIYKIPLKEIPEENYFANIPQLIDRIIIGPSQYPVPLLRSFVELLSEAGVTEPEKKVVLSDIPLRR